MRYAGNRARWEAFYCYSILTNSKSHTGFALVPKSLTLNDMQRRNGRYSRYLTEIGIFGSQLRQGGWS